MNPETTLTPLSTMQDVLASRPDARALLFERYHIGGCATCGFQPEETLARVCRRFGIRDVQEVLDTLRRGRVTPPRFAGPRLDLTAELPHRGALPDADAVGMVGNAECGEAMTVWLKFQDQDGRKVIQHATFESIGCETAIAMAARAMGLLRGRTVEEALALPTEQLVGAEEPLPPLKVHCAQLVESALRAALLPEPHTASHGEPAQA